jgi:signal transduction histidine kinase
MLPAVDAEHGVKGGAVRARLVLAIMGLVSSAAALLSMLVLYQAGAKEQRLHLESLAKSQAGLIEAVARFDALESQDANPAGAWVATLSQVAEGHARWRSLDTSTSLWIVGERSGQIWTHVQDGTLLAPRSEALDGDHTAFVISSRQNGGGTREYEDEYGVHWFEASESIPSLRMAVLARLNLDVVNRPLQNALLVSGGASLVLIALGAFLVRRTNFRTVLDLSRELARRRAAEARLSLHQAELETAVRERTEELQRAHAELLESARFATLGQVTAKVSHELRNPLGTMRTSLHTLRLRAGNPALGADKVLDRLDRNVVRCDRIIEEMLTYTRPRLAVREWLELSSWTSAFLEDYRATQTFNIVASIDEDLRLLVDPEDLRRMLVNLLNNAVEASPTTGRDVELTLRAETSSVVICVQDHGSGMTPETLEKVGEPLFSTKGFGVGLGIAIVKELAERNQGVFQLESQLGVGTSARLRFAHARH